jgi:hypothetical protein
LELTCAWEAVPPRAITDKAALRDRLTLPPVSACQKNYLLQALPH